MKIHSVFLHEISMSTNSLSPIASAVIRVVADSALSSIGAASSIKWTKKHAEKANISGFPTISVICNKLTQDINMDLAPELLAEPARSDDIAYAREVLSSLTPGQFEKKC